MDFTRAEDFILGGRSKQSRTHANNTVLHFIDPDTIGVRLHATDVVLIHRDGTYTLNTGGWYTVTTKDRLNSYAPVSVYSDKGTWYIGSYNGPRNLFQDGMKVDGHGRPLNPVAPSVEAESKHYLAKAKRLVSAYIRGFVESIRANGLAAPSGADCWGCYFRDEKTGDEPMGVSHLLDHFRESYYVPSLLWAAITERHHGNDATCWHMATAQNQGSESWSKTLAAMELRGYFRKRIYKIATYLADSEKVAA